MSKTKEAAEAAGSGLVMVLAVLWGFSAPVGAIYWVVQKDALSAVLSLIVPGYGLVSTLWNVLFG